MTFIGITNTTQVRHLISFETQVIEIKAKDTIANHGFSVSTESLTSRERQVRDYDAVAIANGHYTVPFIPDIPGIQEWNKQYPGSITHSKYYRKPEDFQAKVSLCPTRYTEARSSPHLRRYMSIG